MHYTYDPHKRTSNINKHGIDFDDARSVIASSKTVTFEDNRFDYGEQRYITFGILRNKVVAIATTETEDEIRIISMRWATHYEYDTYYQNCC